MRYGGLGKDLPKPYSNSEDLETVTSLRYRTLLERSTQSAISIYCSPFLTNEYLFAVRKVIPVFVVRIGAYTCFFPGVFPIWLNHTLTISMRVQCNCISAQYSRCVFVGNIFYPFFFSFIFSAFLSVIYFHFLSLVLSVHHMRCTGRKGVFGQMRAAKAQIILRVRGRAGWSGPSLSAYRII